MFGLRFHLKDDMRKKSASHMKSVATFSFGDFLKRDSSASDSEKKKVINVDTDVDGMSDSCGWCTIVNYPI